MSKAGSPKNNINPPHWLLCEVTYRCPLQCPYCSNPVDFVTQKGELTTEEWVDLFVQARELGAVQLGLSGGEPLVRQDLEIMIKEAHDLGFYINLITSGVGMDEERVARFKENGLDTVQISFQASDKELNDYLAGTSAFEHKVAMAKAVKKFGYSLVFNIVIHKLNIDKMPDILDMAMSLGADYVELANTQYYGFALENRAKLLPSREQLQRAEKIAHEYQEKYKKDSTIYYVIPDYYETRPKACMNGWGSVFLQVAPNGLALPCHSARVIPGLEFPHVTDHSLEWIWYESEVFNKFRGFDWMKEPCVSCPERFKDFGGCHCQAYLIAGDAETADPVCDYSPNRYLVDKAIKDAAIPHEEPLVFRSTKSSKRISKLLDQSHRKAS